MVQAIIVNVSTKIHQDGTQVSAIKLDMMSSTGTEQNMTISTLTRMEIMKIFKLVYLPLYFANISAADAPRKRTELNTSHTQCHQLLII